MAASEHEVIADIRRRVGPAGATTLVGVGDDAAVLEPATGLELLTCDAFVEGVHFRRDFATLREIGSKCMVANVSDIAAMGGFPTKAVVSLCVPSGVTREEIMDLYGGILEAGRLHGVEIVGGDVVGSREGIVVSVAVLGAVDRDRVVRRSGAVVGDAVLVTGELGASEAGLRALAAGLRDDPEVREAKRRHLAPVPRIREAQAFLEVATPRAMIDVSDGLASEVRHIAEESGVGVALFSERIPVASAAAVIAGRLGLDATDVALGSGEEFELVVSIPPSETRRTIEHVLAVTGTRVTQIGEVVERSRGCTLIAGDGTSRPLPRLGYEHLKGGGEGEGDGRR